jgi:hypothetical protein
MDQIGADIALKRVQTQWAPWKAPGAGVAVATAIAAAMAVLFSHILR